MLAQAGHCLQAKVSGMEMQVQRPMSESMKFSLLRDWLRAYCAGCRLPSVIHQDPDSLIPILETEIAQSYSSRKEKELG